MSAAPVSCEVCSISCSSWLVLLLLSLFVLHLLLRVRLFGHSSMAPLAARVLSSRGVSGAAFCCLGLLSHPLLQWSSLDSSYSLVVQLLVFSWTLCWSSFLSLPVFADSSGWLLDIPWLSALHCLTAGGVALVFCQGHVGLP